jgi:peptidoglycan hydrolase-like protein with peptidoglycan-binding domain
MIVIAAILGTGHSRYGPATQRAVKDFQAALGLGADGIAYPVTKAAIKLRLDGIRQFAGYYSLLLFPGGQGA